MIKYNFQHLQRLLYTVLIVHKYKKTHKNKTGVCDGCIYAFYPKLGAAAAVAVLCGSIKSSLFVTISITMMMLLVFLLSTKDDFEKCRVRDCCKYEQWVPSDLFPVTAGALFHWSLHLSFGDSAQQHMAVAVSASNMLVLSFPPVALHRRYLILVYGA